MMSKNVKYTKNYFNTDLSWEDLLINFNNSVLSKEVIKHRPVGFYVSHNAIKIDKLKSLYDKLNVSEAHLYISLTSVNDKSIGSLGKHTDTMNVWFWQAKGITKWQISDKEYVLSPGDLIYVPKGVEHCVTSLSPRAGISMSR